MPLPEEHQSNPLVPIASEPKLDLTSIRRWESFPIVLKPWFVISSFARKNGQQDEKYVYGTFKNRRVEIWRKKTMVVTAPSKLFVRRTETRFCGYCAHGFNEVYNFLLGQHLIKDSHSHRIGILEWRWNGPVSYMHCWSRLLTSALNRPYQNETLMAEWYVLSVHPYIPGLYI